MTEDSLRCSLATLVSTFQDALIAVIPTADRLSLEWGDGRQHRDWERLAATLYDVCVRGPIEADATRPGAEYPMPPYDIDVASYAACSWISATSVTARAPAALIRLMTDRAPFDAVQVALLDSETLQPIERVLVPFAEVEFAFVRRSKGQPDVVVHEIEAIE